MNGSGLRMSYFDRLNRYIGRDDGEAEYVCRNCSAGFDERRQVCPDCGSYSIRRREWGPLR
jgi:rRNA maturation endonuclease Nob1